MSHNGSLYGLVFTFKRGNSYVSLAWFSVVIGLVGCCRRAWCHDQAERSDLGMEFGLRFYIKHFVATLHCSVIPGWKVCCKLLFSGSAEYNHGCLNAPSTSKRIAGVHVSLLRGEHREMADNAWSLHMFHCTIAVQDCPASSQELSRVCRMLVCNWDCILVALIETFASYIDSNVICHTRRLRWVYL